MREKEREERQGNAWNFTQFPLYAVNKNTLPGLESNEDLCIWPFTAQKKFQRVINIKSDQSKVPT